jgi:hypothetical protein
LFVHPVMDIEYDNKPSMISETTFTRPNRYRSEAPLYYACYGALQESDALVHFALDGAGWNVKPRFWMQPWTLMSPAMVGQFPAAAMIYRRGLVAPGEVLVDLNLKLQDLLDLKGTPLPQDAAFDELRLADVPQGAELPAGKRIDPLVHYAGRTKVRFTESGGPPRLTDLRPYIDRRAQVVRSATGELTLDYGKGLLTINAAAAQGVSGALKAAGPVKLRDLSVESDLDLGHVAAVSLDGQPLARSARILLQVMSEEKNNAFQTEPTGDGGRRIVSIGRDPWMARRLSGTVRLLRPDAGRLTVAALDHAGYPQQTLAPAAEIKLLPTTLYYLVTAK